MKSSRVVPAHSPALLAKLVAVALSVALFFCGCTSVVTANRNTISDLTSQVRAGDRVDCALRDGSHVKFKVVAVERDALVGETQRVTAADLVEIKISRFDGKQTVGWIILVAAVIVAAPYLKSPVSFRVPAPRIP